MATDAVDKAAPKDDTEGAEESAPAASASPSSKNSHRERDRTSGKDGGAKRSASPQKSEDGEANDDSNPPLPTEGPPSDEAPLPTEAPPEDDGWEYRWVDAFGNVVTTQEQSAGIFFYNRLTGQSQWENPRVPSNAASTTHTFSSTADAPGNTSSSAAPGTSSPQKPVAGGYNPKIHGSYDPNADYAIEARRQEEEAEEAAMVGYPTDPNSQYAATAQFNRFTGRFQNAEITPDMHNDSNKSKRQLNAFFDADAAANSHDGRSLKAERQNKKLSKQELKAYKEKRREKKEEKRRAWLRD